MLQKLASFSKFQHGLSSTGGTGREEPWAVALSWHAAGERREEDIAEEWDVGIDVANVRRGGKPAFGRQNTYF